MKKILAVAVFLILIAFTANAQLNAKTIDSVTVKIVKSGTLVVRDAEKANLSYYIPQEGVRSVNVIADGASWRYVSDSFNNKLVLLEWTRPSGTINYNIEIVVENTAKHTYSDKQVGTDNFYLKDTQYIKINDDIRQFAFPYEKSMERAAELTKLVYDYLEYDLDYVGRNVPSDRVLVERRGVCVEHANLLAALLRVNEIPTRYVVGYAYSSVQEKFIGHTWVEVLAEDGSWVPFDPTWLQAGYIDATHIKSAVLLDNSQIDTLTYVGKDIEWTRNEEEITLLSYSEKNVTSLSTAGTEKVASGAYGYVKVLLSANECTIADVKANSCVDNADTKQFDVLQPERSFWTCGPTDIYWFFKASGNNYICPLNMYDQTGGEAEFRVTVQGKSAPRPLFISGPDTIGANEFFTLTASTDGVFYSHDFGINQGRSWQLNIKNPGTYKFYLYSDGSLYVKDVTAVQKKEFELRVDAPETAKLNANFGINVTVKNLLDTRIALITVAYTNQTIRTPLALEKNEEKTLSFSLTSNREGIYDLVVSATGNSLASQTAVVNTPVEKNFSRDVFDKIASFFSDIIDGILSLFGRK